MNKLKLGWALGLGLVCNTIFAQVKQNVIVEHFTNTNCSVCASRNPGFYSNLNQNTDLRHIAYHPSAPYASCFFSKQNKIENDDRTKYYGIFGGTPRLVIQGAPISSAANYNSSTIFEPYIAKTTPIQINVTIANKGADSITVKVVLTTMVAHSLGNMRLFAAVVEKEVAYAAGNGEITHYDVFRKSIFETAGMPITLSGTSGDSVTYTATVYKKSDWANSQLYAVAILNKESDKTVVQTNQSNLLSIASGLNKLVQNSFELFPNPTTGISSIVLLEKTKLSLSVLDITGKIIIKNTNFLGGEIDLSAYPNGLYFIQLGDQNNFVTKKIIKQ